MSKIITHLDENILNQYRNQLLVIKNNFEIIKKEANKIPIEAFVPFNDGNKDNNYWNVYIVKSQNKKNDIKNYAPDTYEILKDKSFVNVFFSILKSNTKINLHKDSLYFLYRSHLGIDVPKECKFFCKNTDITTLNGEINFFDLTDEHYAYNNSETHRIVLVVDIIKKQYELML